LRFVNELVFRANLTSARRLDTTAFVTAMFAFLTFVAVWTIGLICVAIFFWIFLRSFAVEETGVRLVGTAFRLLLFLMMVFLTRRRCTFCIRVRLWRKSFVNAYLLLTQEPYSRPLAFHPTALFKEF
jgi:hypothetical protein